MQDITLPQGESILRDLDAVSHDARSRVKHKITNRLEEARTNFNRLHRLLLEAPEVWDMGRQVQLERAEAYVRGLELAKMIILEEGL